MFAFCVHVLFIIFFYINFLGATALHVAASKGYLQVIRYVLLVCGLMTQT